MGVFQQLKLLFKKNYLIRKRQPGILALEVLWPLFIVAIVTVIRQGVPPIENDTCHFQERAMPSAGVVPFLQTFVCNLDNKCQSKEELAVAQDASYRVSALVSELAPYVGSQETVDALKMMDQGYKIVESLNKLAVNNSFLKDLDKSLQVKNLFKDANQVKMILMKDYGFTNEEVVDALMNSTVNVTNVLDLIGYADIRGIVCDPEKLKNYLLFPEQVNVTDVSHDLCSINMDKISEITQVIQDNLDIPEIVRLIGLFEKFKDTLTSDYTVSQGFMDIADMLDLVFKSPSIKNLMKSMSSLKDISGIIRKVPKWIELFQNTAVTMQPINDLFGMLNPIMNQVLPGDPIWKSIVSGVHTVNSIINMVEGNFNGTSKDIVNIVDQFLGDLQNATDGMSMDIKMILETLADINIGDIINQAINQTMNQENIFKSLDELQETLMKTSYWNITGPVVTLANKMLKMINVTTTKALELENAINEFINSDNSVEGSLNQLLAQGPEITKAVLDAFTDSNVISKMIQGSFSYMSVCESIVEKITMETDSSTGQQIKGIICTNDLNNSIQKFLQSMDLNTLQHVINDTVSALMDIANDKMVTDSDTSLSQLYKNTQGIIEKGIQLVHETKQTWGQIFSGFTSKVMVENRRHWQPVLEMLDANYIGSSVIAMGRAMGDNMYTSPFVGPMSKYIHMVDLVVQYVYHQMKVPLDIYSRDSPLGQLAQYGIEYAPELAGAFMDMMNPDNIYTLMDSDDILTTICTKGWIKDMNVPPYVPTSNIQDVICKTDWQKMMKDIMGENYQSTLLVEMDKTMRDWDMDVTYNMSMDWINIIDYTERSMDLLMDPETQQALMNGMANIFMGANYTKMMKVMDVLEEKTAHWGFYEYARYLDMGVLIMDQIDKSLTNEARFDSTWLTIKKTMLEMDALLNMVNKQLPNGMTSLKDLIDPQPEGIKELINGMARVVPYLIDAMKETLLYPEVLMQKIFKDGFQTPNCVDVFLSDYMIDSQNKVHEFEQIYCRISQNWTNALKIDDPTVMEFADTLYTISQMTPLQLGNLKVNWTSIANNLDKMMLLAPKSNDFFTNPNFYPFNTKGIEMSWSQLLDGLNTLNQQFGPERISALTVDVQRLMMTFLEMVPTNDTESIPLMIESQFYMNSLFSKFGIKQLEYFNSTRNVNIVDYIGSNEMRKVFNAMEAAPDLVQILFNLLDKLMTDPSMSTVLSDMKTLEGLCTDVNAFVKLFDMSDVNMSPAQVQKLVCDINLNITVLLEELQENMPGFSELMDGITKILSPNITKDDLKVNFTEIAQDSTRLSVLINDVIVNPPTFTFLSNMDWMNGTIYEAKFKKFIHEINSTIMNFDARYIIAYELQTLETSFQDNFTKPVFHAILNYINFALDVNDNLTTVSVQDEFAGYPNLQKLMEVAEEFPDALEVVVYNLFINSEMFTELISAMLAPNADLCSVVDGKLDVPPMITFDMSSFIQKICTMNFTLLDTEVMEMGLIPSEEVKYDYKKMADRIVSLFEGPDMSLRVGLNLRLFNISVYEKMIQRVEIYANQSLQVLMDPNSMFKTLGRIYTTSTPEVRQMLSFLPVTMAVLDSFMDRILSVENDTSFALDDMFKDSPEIQKAIRFLQEPGVIDVLLNSANSPKFQTLLMSTNVTETFRQICDPRVDLNQYFNSMGYDLHQLRVQFCGINILNLIEEGKRDFDVILIENIMAGTADIDWNTLGDKYTRFSQLITRWVYMPPNVQVPDEWKNETFWLDKILKYNNYQMSPEGIVREIENILRSMGAIFNEGAGKEFGLILESVLRIMNKNFVGLQNQTLTVSNILYTIPAFKDIMNAIGISGDILTPLLTAPVKDPELFLKTLTQSDFNKVYCGNTSAWYQILDLPPTFEISPLNLAVCKNNGSQLLDNLIQNFELEHWMAFYANYSVPFNMESVISELDALSKNIASFLKYPPTFNASKTEKMLMENYNETNLWKMLETYSVMSQLLMNGTGEGVDMYFRMGSVIFEFLNEMLEKMTVNGVTLDLASLFKNSPTFLRILETFMDLTPDPINGILGVTLKLDKSVEFTQAVMDPVRLNEIFCIKSKFEEYFNVPAEFDVNVVLNGLCNLNFTLVASELPSEFPIEALIQNIQASLENTSPFNIQTYIQDYQKFNEILAKFYTVQNVTFDGRDFTEVFNINGTILVNNLQRMVDITQNYGTTSLPTELLNLLLMDNDNSTDWFNPQSMIYLFDIYLKQFNENLRYIKDKPLSLDLLVNRTEVGPILMTVLMKPEWLEDLVYIQFKPDKLIALLQDGSRDKLCGSEFWDAFILPANRSAALHHLQEGICQMNTTVAGWESINMQINGYRLYQQYTMIVDEMKKGKRFSPNITEVETDVRETVQLLTDLINSFKDNQVNLNQFVDIEGFNSVIQKFQGELLEKLMSQLTIWSNQLNMLNLYMNNDTYTARSINTNTLIMNIFNDRLKDIEDGRISLESLLDNTQPLIDMVNTFIDAARFNISNWTNGQIDFNKLSNLTTNMEQLQVLCTQGNTVASYINGGITPTPFHLNLQTVLCSIPNFPAAFKQFIDYEEIEKQLNDIWNMSVDVVMDVEAYQNSIDTLNQRITKLANTKFTVDNRLESRFDNRMIQFLEGFFTNPSILMKIIGSYGGLIDKSVTDQRNYKIALSVVSNVLLLPATEMMQKLEENGLTLDMLLSDPKMILNAVEILSGYDTQVGVATGVNSLNMNRITANSEFVNTVLCNHTAMESVIGQLVPAAQFDQVQTLLCRNDAGFWAIRFNEARLDQEMLLNIYSMLTVKLDEYVCDNKMGYLYCNYSFREPNFTFMEVMQQVAKLAEYFMVKGNNISSSWSNHDTGSEMAWKIVKNILLETPLESLTNTMIMSARMSSPVGSEVNLHLFSFINSVEAWLNGHLENFIDASQPVKLQDVLPKSDKVKELLEQMFEPEAASEFLTMLIDPQRFGRLAYMDFWKETACNMTAFNETFSLSEYSGLDVIQMQNDLCEVAINRTSFLKQLIDQIDASDMIQKLQSLLLKTDSDQNIDGVKIWETFRNGTKRLIDNLEKITQVHFDGDSFMGWIQPILNIFTDVNSPIFSSMEPMCEKLLSYVNGTEEYQDMYKHIIKQVIGYMNTAIVQMNIYREFDDIFCDWSVDYDLGAMIKELKDLYFFDLFSPESFVNSAKPNCPAIKSTVQNFMDTFNQTMQDPLDFRKLGVCINHISMKKFSGLLQSVDSVFELSADLLTIVQQPGMIETLRKLNPELQPILDYVLKVIVEQKPVEKQFIDLFTNSTTIMDYFTNVLKIAPSITESLLSSTINLDTAKFLNGSVEEVQKRLCNASQLAELIELPPLAKINFNTLSDLLCPNNSNDVAFAIKSAADVSRITKELLSLVDTGVSQNFLNNMTDHVINLFTDFESISGMVDLLGGDLNLQNLDINKIDRFLMGSGPERIVRSLTAILDDLKYVFPNNQSKVILDEISMFVKGLMGIDLIQSRLLKLLTVADILSDPLAVENYLINELGFTRKMALNVLGGKYSLRVFLGPSMSMSDYDCDKLFDELIIINSTDVELSDIKDIVCYLNETMATSLGSLLVPKLDIGDMVKMYITSSADSIMNSLDLTPDTAKKLTESVAKAQTNFMKAAEMLQTSNDTLRNDLVEQLINPPQALSANGLSSIEDIMCGRKSSDGLIDSTFSVETLINIDNLELKDAEMNNLPTEFCQDLYKEIMAKPIGSIIWAYLKPIMRGKILYTPVTPVTERIIERASGMFKIMQDVQKVAQAWITGVPSLKRLIMESENLGSIKTALQSNFIQGMIQSTTGINTEALMGGLSALESEEFTPEQIDGLQYMAQLLLNYTECMELSRFEGLETEEELEKKSKALSEKNTFLAGIVFTNVLPQKEVNINKRSADEGETLPKHVKYKLRMDSDNVASTHRIKRRSWKPGPNADFATDMRYMRGFVQLQDMIEKAIIAEQMNGITDNSTVDPGIYLQQFPYPCYIDDDYIHYLGSYLLPVLMTFAWLAALGIATRNLLYDREDGQEESLRLMGMKCSLNWIAWFLSTMLIMILVCIFMAVILKFGTIFRFSNFLIIVLYLVTFCFSSTLLCYMVSAFFIRTTLAILTVLIVYFLSYLPYVILVAMDVEMVFWQKIVACLSSTTAFSFGAGYLSSYEELGHGLQWSNIHTPLVKDDRMTFHWTCIMMLIDGAIYLVIGWYVRNVKAGKYGISRPWYFPLTSSYWGCGGSPSSSSKYQNNDSNTDSMFFEASPTNFEAGIRTRNLRKEFNGMTAVNNLSLSLYENQVTALLGHNGAAKTTTMNMITGIIEPTSGEVLIYNKLPSNCSGLLGICPQHNAIFDFMTVEEHMEFYAGIKSDRISQDEIKNLLKDVDLWHVRGVQGKNLSGGMQRRLCIALAFVGGSRAIILDEPTSGVDPYARKNIWNLILNHKLGRTVLVSTHHLDEADMIGDNVAILHTGQLLCSGSPVFLKSLLGDGLSLTIEKQQAVSDTENATLTSDVTEFITSYHPNAELTEDIGTELEYKLPKDGQVSWPQFFLNLDHNKPKLKIASYGVSDSTLEEVFLKVTKIVDNGEPLTADNLKGESRRRERANSNSTGSDTTSENSSGADIIKKSNSERLSGCSLIFHQLGALLVKRFHHFRRDWRMIVSSIILPVLLILAAVGFSQITPDRMVMPSMMISPEMYGPHSYMIYKDDMHNDFSKDVSNSMMSYPGVGSACMNTYDVPDGLSCMAKDEADQIFHSTNETIHTCHCVNTKFQCDGEVVGFSPPEMMTVSTDMVQDLAGHNIDQYLLNTFHQFIDKRYGGWSFEMTEDKEPAVKVWFNNKGYHAMPAFRNAYSNFYLRSLMHNDSDSYGITLYNHPISLSLQPLSADAIEQNASDVGIAIIVLLAFSFIPSALILTSINERLNNEKHIQAISGVGSFFYWIATLLWDMFIYNISVLFAVIVIVIIQPGSYYDRNNLGGFAVLLILFGWSILPFMYCTLRLFKSGSAAYLVLFCVNMFIGIMTVMLVLSLVFFKYMDAVDEAQQVLKYLFLIFPQYCLAQGLIDMSTNQFQYKLFERFGDDVYREPFSFDLLGWNYIALGIQGLVFFIITLIIEFKPDNVDSIPSDMVGDYNKEEDVQTETERIEQNQAKDDVLVVNKLSKVFRRGLKKFLAVDNISFGVHRGECFGLLGVNGAGKTTSFRMLTGDLEPTKGFATVKGKRVCGKGSSISEARSIGYCPQYGGLDNYLTSQEILLFYARIKGLSGEQATSAVEKLINKLKLTDYADKQIRTYSGGNKRKVSLAVALMADPEIVLLDEPTTGMDPGTRRLAWKVINSATKNGQSVVLSSHSMDECDHLCSRLAIMVNGQLKCLGSPQHLKNKFGDGYIIRMTIPGLSTNKIDVIQEFISRFPGTQIKEETAEVLQLDIPQDSARIADLFALLEGAQYNKQISDYSIAQTSLDEVFISFAKEQSDSVEDEDASNSSSGGSGTTKSTPEDYVPRTTYKKDFAFNNPGYDSFKLSNELVSDAAMSEDGNWLKYKL